ncbi:MAG: YdaU family protein [Ketobacter sp.]|nr:YdaU family protein [Ketobacter sp.]
MSLPYFPMYPKDYEAKTPHLTLEEDGAYIRLLRIMWLTPKCSIPNDPRWIMRRMRIDQDTYDRVVSVIIDEFMTISQGRIHNKRLMKEYKRTNEAHERRVTAGRKGGNSNALNYNDSSQSNASSMLQASGKQPEPEPYKKKDISNDISKEKKPSPKNSDDEPFFELTKHLPKQISHEVIKHRKRIGKPLTKFAAKLLAGNFAKTGQPTEAAEMMIASGWQGFKPEWFTRQQNTSPHKPFLTKADRNKKAIDNAKEYFADLEKSNNKQSPPRLINKDNN